ncbi:hypothetical protein [uncultured Alistipes sp.]|uniref:hypothetical protein n=1 Tax=uncultured Alistipes sp. TaxID=538949 RepID=UPI00260224BC|nr:hypothetical protein [uncultured Alistipes sp.]
MQQRIQFVLILLLFVLTGSLQSLSFDDTASVGQAVLTRTASDDAAVASRANCFSVPLHLSDISVETPVVSYDHKACFRQREGIRAASDAVFGPSNVLRAAAPVPYGSAVDYYIFTLERILV